MKFAKLSIAAIAALLFSAGANAQDSTASQRTVKTTVTQETELQPATGQQVIEGHVSRDSVEAKLNSTLDTKKREPGGMNEGSATAPENESN